MVEVLGIESQCKQLQACITFRKSDLAKEIVQEAHILTPTICKLDCYQHLRGSFESKRIAIQQKSAGSLTQEMTLAGSQSQEEVWKFDTRLIKQTL